MVSITRWLTLSRQQWKVLLWAIALLYLIYLFLAKRVQLVRERFDNIHYQVITLLVSTPRFHELPTNVGS